VCRRWAGRMADRLGGEGAAVRRPPTVARGRAGGHALEEVAGGFQGCSGRGGEGFVIAGLARDQSGLSLTHRVPCRLPDGPAG